MCKKLQTTNQGKSHVPLVLGKLSPLQTHVCAALGGGSQNGVEPLHRPPL